MFIYKKNLEENQRNRGWFLVTMPNYCDVMNWAIQNL